MEQLKNFFYPPKFADETLSRRANLLSFIVNVHLVTATCVAVALFILLPDDLTYSFAALFSTLPALGVRWLLRRGQVTLAAFLFIGFIAALMPLIAVGSNSSVGTVSVTAFQFITIVMAGLLLGGRGGIGFLILTSVINGLLLYAQANGWYQVQSTFGFLQTWFVQTTTYGAVAGLLWFANRLIQDSFSRERRANQELRELSATLEQRVANRTRDLEVASQVARQTTTLLTLDELLPRIVTETRAAFELYQVMAFLYDAAQERLTLGASTFAFANPSTQTLTLHSAGLIPKAATTRTLQLVNDVSQSPDYRAIPEFPKTKAELVLPMLVGDELMGVLDFEADKAERFTSNDVRVFQSLADQLAVAIRNAHSYESQVRVAEELRALDTLKTQFLATMSHELRTPLNSIINFSELMAMGSYGDVNQEQRTAMTFVNTSGKHLLSLINDVLDISKIQANMITLFLESNVSLNEELETAATVAASLIGDKPVQLVKQVPPDLPLMTADRRRIRQIFINLLSNACRFTETGQVVLKAERQNGNILVTVQDTGPGIAPQDQALIFEPFHQSHAGLEKGTGTGLGLPIAKSLVQAHHGQLWLESRENVGSTFFVSLPIESSDAFKTNQT